MIKRSNTGAATTGGPTCGCTTLRSGLRSLMVSILVLVMLALHARATAQDFKIKTTLNAAQATGFYRIPLTPDLSGYTNTDLSDIRIADGNTFIPYIIRGETQIIHPGSFTRFNIINNTSDSNSTIIDLENPLHQGITDLSLVIKNTSVQRYTSLSGSDDRNKWFIIDEQILFQRSGSSNADNYVQTTHFPQSTYKYFRLKINNAHTDPLNITDAGIFTSGDTYAPPGYTDNPAPTFIQKDSNNHISYVLIRNKAAYLTAQLQLTLTAPRFYNRTVTLHILPSDADSNSLQYEAGSFTLSAALPPLVTIKTQKALSILLKIDNKDNPPLKITGITTRQEQQYLIAWLEAGKNYTLLAGNPQLTQPDYDLSRFKDSIPTHLPTLAFGPLTVPQKSAPLPATQTGNNSIWLWPAIILAIAVLGFLTWRLLRDVKNEQ